MGLYRKFNNLIFFTIAGSIVSVIILGVAIGTKHWYGGTLTSNNEATTSKITVQYGLFAGIKTRYINDAPEQKNIHIVCLAGENVCMFSCGKTADSRKSNLETLLKEPEKSCDTVFCLDATECPGATAVEDSTNPPGTGVEKDLFLNFALWLTTLLFLCGGMLFSTVAGIQAMYNTYRAPSLPIFSVFGLYIWNGVSAACTFLVLILWGVAFGIGLKENPAVSDTLLGTYENDSTSLGYSYWIIILAELLCLANIGILRYRTWKIHQIETTLRVVNDKIVNHETLLF